jgi:ferredoxin
VSFVDGEGADATNRWGVRQRACIGCGDCFSGCNHSSKNTLATNYLALARRRGAELFTGITVLKVCEAQGARGCWDLELCITDRKVDRRFRNEEKVSLRLRARHVILAGRRVRF